MNHPLRQFHRPRHGSGLREAASGRNANSDLPAKWLDAKPRVIPEAVATLRMPTRAPPPPAPPPFAPPQPAEKPRWRWYQYSLRSLLVLMLLVSLFMSWFAVKRKRALAQKKAVEAIVAAGGTVQYDYEFDENGEWVKGATGLGPQWLRKLVGADYFDNIESVQVGTTEEVEGLAGLANLKSLEIDVTGLNASGDANEWIKCLPEIDGVDEVTIKGVFPYAALDGLGRLKRLKRLTLDYQNWGPQADETAAPDFSGLQSCRELRGLTILNCADLPEKTLAGLNTLTQLERLDICRTSLERCDIARLSDLTKLRELEIVPEQGHGIAPMPPRPDQVAESVLILEHIEKLGNFKQLEKLSLAWSGLMSSDLKFLCDLPALRELDLSHCPNIDDSAAPYLKKMKRLRFLNLEGAKVTEAAAESIDEALSELRSEILEIAMRLRRRTLLRTALVIAALIATGAWLIMRVWTAYQQNNFLSSMKAAGGRVVMDYEDEGRFSPRTPLWLRGIAGDWPYRHVARATISSDDEVAAVGQFDNVREVDGSAAYNVVSGWKPICRCRHLQKLCIPYYGVADSSAFTGLANLHELISIDIPIGALDASYLTCFKHMPQIRTLRIADLDDKGLRRLRFLKQLEELDLQGTSIQGPGLSALSGMKKLRKLDLHGNPIIATHLAILKDLDSLEELDLSNTEADDDSMASLAGLKNLKRLNVQGTHVRGPGLRKLYRLKNQLRLRITLNADDMEDVDGAVPIAGLELADFPRVRLTENGFDHLTLYPMLEELDLSRADMDDAHAKLLGELTKLKKLNLANTLVTDAALEHLRGLNDLRELHVEQTRITNAGKQKIRAALPQVKFDGEK